MGLWALPSVALANPAVQACEGKSEGDSCGLMKMVKPADGGELERKTVPGACASDECCDLDYSKGSPPETVCHACLACKEGPPAVTSPGGEAKQTEPAAGEPPRADDGPPAQGPNKQRGCSIAADSSDFGPWLVVLVGVAFIRRRS